MKAAACAAAIVCIGALVAAEDRRWENPVFHTAEEAAAAAEAELVEMGPESPAALRLFVESVLPRSGNARSTVDRFVVTHPLSVRSSPTQRRTVERFEAEMPRQRRVVERRLARFGYPELPGLVYCRLVGSVDAFAGLNETSSDRMSRVGGVTYYCRYVVLPLSYVGTDNLRELQRSAALNPGLDVDATLQRWERESFASLVNTFRHELVHVHTNSALDVPAYSDRSRYPTWFHEGSATYLAGDPHSGLSGQYREYQKALFYLVQRFGVRRLQRFYGSVLGGHDVVGALAGVYAIAGSDELFRRSSRWSRTKNLVHSGLWIVALGLVAMAFRGSDLPVIGWLMVLLSAGLAFSLATGLAQHLFGLHGTGAVLLAQLVLGTLAALAGVKGVLRIRRHSAGT
jgi:hypothetical protein